MAQLVGRAEVGHRERLSAGHVDVGLHRDVGDPLGTHLGDDPAQLVEIDVALERVGARRVMGLVDDHVDEGAARVLLMESGGREVHVPRDDVALA